MKRFNLYDMYAAGRCFGVVSKIESAETTQTHAYILWTAREFLESMLAPDSPLLGSARRSGQKVVEAIDKIIPRSWLQINQIPNDEQINQHRSWEIRSTLFDFETVLRNEMPDVAAYVVAQKGIYRTEDLIANADKQISAVVRNLTPAQTSQDIREAGKCLAFELGTASAFHLWRAVEAMMAQYFENITHKTFKAANVQRNWGAYIRALKDAGADERVTVLLEHIKNEYRNPQTHPDATVTVSDAQRLFAVAVSAIDQMLFSCNSRTVANIVTPSNKQSGEEVGLLGGP